MTVHGAKGLEAPIVILADTRPAGRPRIRRACSRLPAARRARRARPHRLGRAQGRPTCRRCAPRATGGAGGRGRISPSALRRDDARGRAPDRVRRGGRADAAGGLLVRPGTRCARAAWHRGAGRGGRRMVRRYAQGRARCEASSSSPLSANARDHALPAWLARSARRPSAAPQRCCAHRTRSSADGALHLRRAAAAERRALARGARWCIA